MKITNIEDVGIQRAFILLNHPNVIPMIKTQKLLGRGAKKSAVPRKKFWESQIFYLEDSNNVIWGAYLAEMERLLNQKRRNNLRNEALKKIKMEQHGIINKSWGEWPLIEWGTLSLLWQGERRQW